LPETAKHCLQAENIRTISYHLTKTFVKEGKIKCTATFYINLVTAHPEYPRAAQIVAYHLPCNIQLLLLFYFLSPVTPV
jgi:hypothetical protein